MEKAFKIATKILSTLVVSAVIIIAILLAGVRLVGLTPYTVLSGSMEPAIHIGSVIYVKDVDPAELKVKDTITFQKPGESAVTHRIVEIKDEGTGSLSFKTQGDANNADDGFIPADAIIGKAVFSIPYLGYISSFVQSPTGLLCIVGGTVVVIGLSYLMEALFKNKEEQ